METAEHQLGLDVARFLSLQRLFISTRTCTVSVIHTQGLAIEGIEFLNIESEPFFLIVD
jgi:hypothetical protein